MDYLHMGNRRRRMAGRCHSLGGTMDREKLEELLQDVYENADPDWRQTAEVALRFAAQTKPEVTVDDVWDLIDQFDVETHEHKAIGPVMKNGGRDRIIERTNRTAITRRPTRNRGDVRVWRSLIYKGDPND